jgi:hypothetical protein
VGMQIECSVSGGGYEFTSNVSFAQSFIIVINFASAQVSVFPAAPGAEGTKFLFL